MDVKSVQPENISTIVQIARECGLGSWSPTDFGTELQRTDSIFLVAFDEKGNLAGYVLGRVIPGPRDDSESAELYNIGVLTDLRRKNVGTRLLQAFLDACKKTQVNEVFLEVRTSNNAAIKLYEKHGFTAQYRRPSFYSTPTEDATVMRAII